jgi:hypothetical protein
MLAGVDGRNRARWLAAKIFAGVLFLAGLLTILALSWQPARDETCKLFSWGCPKNNRLVATVWASTGCPTPADAVMGMEAVRDWFGERRFQQVELDLTLAGDANHLLIGNAPTTMSGGALTTVSGTAATFDPTAGAEFTQFSLPALDTCASKDPFGILVMTIDPGDVRAGTSVANGLISVHGTYYVEDIKDQNGGSVEVLLKPVLAH